ncbi:MAG: glycosyl hydrolase, partial [Acidobacteriota bacterium]
PSQFYHHTWWKYYDRFTEFATRCSHLLSGGTHVAKVLVLYPLTSVWANYVPQHRDAVGGLTESDFNYLADALLRLHYDFDYVDEDVLARATIEGRTLRIGDERYEVLILPPVTHVKGATFEAMKKFAKSGGSIIAGALLPVEFMETSHTAAAGPVQGLFGLHPGRLLEKFRNGGNGALRLEHRNGRGNVFVLHGKGLHEAKSPRMLKHALERCITPDVTVSDEEVFYLHRVKNGIDLYFFVNTSQTDRGSVEISFERTAKPELWDPATGAMTPIHVYEVKNGRLFLRLDFPAVATHVVVLDGEIPAAHISRSTLHVESFSGDVITGTAGGGIVPSAEVVLRGRKQRVSARPHARRKPLVLKNNFTFDIEGDNVLALSSWKMTTEADPGDAGRFPLPAFDDSAWLPVVNGAWEVQLPQERYNPTYPVVLWYRTEFTVRDLPAEGTRMLIDGFSGLEYTLYLNGEEVRDKGTRSALDAEIREVGIQRFLKRGRNLVAVRLVVNRRTDGILDLLKIVGRFSLAPAHQGYEIVNTIAQPDFGDWTQQGYPCYSGTGSYSMEFDLPANYLEGELLLEVDCGEDVLEASVNGSPGIVRPWHPYFIDISPLVKEGTNTLTLKVTNTLINILEAVEKPSGVMRPPRIVHRHRYQLRLAR